MKPRGGSRSRRPFGIKPAEQTPPSLLILIESIEHLLPPSVRNVVNDHGPEASKPLASNKRIGKIAFNGYTATGRLADRRLH